MNEETAIKYDNRLSPKDNVKRTISPDECCATSRELNVKILIERKLFNLREQITNLEALRNNLPTVLSDTDDYRIRQALSFIL